MAVRTVYLRPWQPPPFSPSRSTAGIPRGSGAVGPDPEDLIGTITILVNPPGPVAYGESVTLTAVRTGGAAAPLTYQWYTPDGQPIPGATGNSYTFTATASGTYTVVVDSPDAVDTPITATVAVVVLAPTIGNVTVTGPSWVDVTTAAWLMEDSGYIKMELSGDFLLET